MFWALRELDRCSRRDLQSGVRVSSSRRGWSKVLGAVGGRGGGRGMDAMSSCNVKAGGLSV